MTTVTIPITEMRITDLRNHLIKTTESAVIGVQNAKLFEDIIETRVPNYSTRKVHLFMLKKGLTEKFPDFFYRSHRKMQKKNPEKTQEKTPEK